MRSIGLRVMWTLYHSSASLTTVFHHSLADMDKSEIIGSASNIQSPKIKGPCCGSQGAKAGKSGEPDLMTSTPLIIPLSSFDSVMRFCISRIESIISFMNSIDFSVKAVLGC